MNRATLSIYLFSAVALIALGYAWGYLPEHDKFVTFKAKVEQAGADQKSRSEATDKINAQLKEATLNDFKTTLDHNTRAWNKRLQNPRPGCSTLPGNTAPSSGVIENPADTLPDYRTLVIDCQATTVMLESLQGWARALQ